MNDLIRREDAIKVFIDWGMKEFGFHDLNRNERFIDALSALPSAKAVQEWIPCSERLPSESGDYLCTIPLNADETYTEVLTFHKGRFYEDDDEWGATYHDDVIAWMPLPEPYKGGDDE